MIKVILTRAKTKDWSHQGCDELLPIFQRLVVPSSSESNIPSRLDLDCLTLEDEGIMIVQNVGD